ncbi:MAG: mCpol domain-containing protein [Acidobacteriota bacterium]|nr:mCpol domain-containing protein [Acidobacteriota bacterium]
MYKDIFYAFFDGDDVSNTIEILLIEGKISEAREISEKIKAASWEIEEMLRSKSGVEVIIFGGDDLLIKYDLRFLDPAFLETIRAAFIARTGISMSCGVGSSIPSSIQSLRLAKLYGKNQIRTEGGIYG